MEQAEGAATEEQDVDPQADGRAPQADGRAAKSEEVQRERERPPVHVQLGAHRAAAPIRVSAPNLSLRGEAHRLRRFRLQRNPPDGGGARRTLTHDLDDDVVIDHDPFSRSAPRPGVPVRDQVLVTQGSAGAEHVAVTELGKVDGVPIAHGQSVP